MEKTKLTPKDMIEEIVNSSEDDIKDFVQKASDNFVYGSDNCSEAIASSIAEFDQVPSLQYKAFVSGFGKGIAGKGETCGALLSGISFISKYAAEKGYNKKEIREFAQKFYDNFEQTFKGTLCKHLSGHDCDVPFDKDFDLHTCGVYIAFSTKYALEFAKKLKENQKN
ncbi:MAG: C-GCAxxG-C-C family protein [Leptospiraceae bacterium]|nr:C-GCAxxG-C-C family protein [Leptospiraceae bacterium]MDW7976074.1 C-GCAxxG-C-C family protein [Leptospiraceae bacterium]